MDSYEERLEKFIEENKEKLDKLKKIESKMKKVEEMRKELKTSIQDSLSEHNLQGYSDQQVTISKRSGSTRWGFVKTLTKEEKDEIQSDLCDQHPDWFEYSRIADSWAWRFSVEG